MKVHAATVEHKHGSNLHLATTAEGLERQLFAYVESWWRDEMDDKPMPDDEAQAIRDYFDTVEDEYLTRFGEEEVED